MIFKNFLFVLILSVLFFEGYSQCTPVHFPGPQLTMPDTSQGLKPAVATVSYHEVVHVRIPHDTIIPPLTVPLVIDSAGINDILGLPPGLSYVTNSANDYWPGGSYGCIVIQGTAAEADTGVYQVTIQVLVSAASNFMGFDYTFDMEVLDSVYAGISSEERHAFTLQQNKPNPFSHTTLIRFHALHPGLFTFEVYDMLGMRKYHEDFLATTGVNSLVFAREDLPAGVYFYRLSNGETTLVRRMIIR